MSSQLNSGNSQESVAYIGHNPPFTIASEAEPDSLSRQEFQPRIPQPDQQPLTYDMGLRYMQYSLSDDPQ
jgi:hypothetical protein